MTFLESKKESPTKNIILECSSKITFDDVSENLKKVIKTMNKSYFKREYMFLSVDSFYKYTGKLNKENHTEQYFIIFFKNKKEFLDMINNVHIDIEEINKKDINFIYVIPNTFRQINSEERYELFNHLYLDMKEKVKWISKPGEEATSELLSKSGFKTLSPYAQLDILEHMTIDKEELKILQFSGTLSEDVATYYLKNIYKSKGFGISALVSKMNTLF